MRELPQTKVVAFDGHRWRLPQVLPFFTGAVVKASWCFYEVIGYRPPKPGEYYLSGCDEHGRPEVWRALGPMSSPYLVVTKGQAARQVSFWEPEGEPVTWVPKMTKSDLRVQLRRIGRALERAGCQFFACDGPDRPAQEAKTCYRCRAIQDLRRLIREL